MDNRRPSIINRQSPLTSLAFWLSLFAAAGLYALAFLAPRLLEHAEQRRVYVANQHRLVALERQAEHLSRVVAALERDPSFVEELARSELDAARPGEQRIAVEPSLTLSGDHGTKNKHPRWKRSGRFHHPGCSYEAWYLPLLRPFAGDRGLQRGLLVVSALIVVLAFTFLQESPADSDARVSASLPRLSRRWLARYRRQSTAP